MSSKSRKGFHFVRVLIYFSFGRMLASPWLVPPSFDTSGVDLHSGLSTHDIIARSLFRADLAKHFSLIGRGKKSRSTYRFYQKRLVIHKCGLFSSKETQRFTIIATS